MIGKFFRNVINTATAAVVNALRVIEGLALGEGEKEKWFRVTPFAEVPGTMEEKGKSKPCVQVIDRAAGELMVANFGTLTDKLRYLFQGLPIYEGHPDDPGWLAKNPGAKETAVGRLKELQVREDGVWGRGVFNSAGVDMLTGEAPKYSAQSPNFRVIPVAKGSDRVRPYCIISLGLTNRPNISDNAISLNTGDGNPSPMDAGDPAATPENNATSTNETDMKLSPEVMKRLGFAPDATPDQSAVEAAICKLHDDLTAANTCAAEAKGKATAANTRADTAETELATLRKDGNATAINTAISENRITAADKDMWEKVLDADPVNGKALLAKQKATTLNTATRLPGREALARTLDSEPNTITAINEAVRAFAAANNLDLSKTADYDLAFLGAKEAKPEIFARK